MHPVFKGEGLIFLFWPGIYRNSGPKIKSRCLLFLRQRHLCNHLHFCRELPVNLSCVRPDFLAAASIFQGTSVYFQLSASLGLATFCLLPTARFGFFLACFRNISSQRQVPVLVWDDSLELVLCKVPAKQGNPEVPLFSWAATKKLTWVTSAFRDPKSWMYLSFSWMRWQPSSLLPAKLRVFYGVMVGIFPLFSVLSQCVKMEMPCKWWC